jgi:small subunit ribosomal protein S2
LPVVALVDTNCDPDEADYVIPGNDDAIKSCDLVIRTIVDAIEAGKQKVKPEEFEVQAAEEPAAEPPTEEAPAEEQVATAESAEEPAQTEEAAQPPVRDNGPTQGEPESSPGEAAVAPQSEEVPAE